MQAAGSGRVVRVEQGKGSRLGRVVWGLYHVVGPVSAVLCGMPMWAALLIQARFCLSPATLRPGECNVVPWVVLLLQARSCLSPAPLSPTPACPPLHR